MEAIILAGGLGTRLRSVVEDAPKCMAPIGKQPFLHFVTQQLLKQGVQKFIFALGYKHNQIEAWLKHQTFDYDVVIEQEPFGTGGAIQLALSKANKENVIVTNGDTLVKAEIQALYATHQQNQSACTLTLKPMQNFERYGVVELNSLAQIVAFKEKQYFTSGLINAGLYCLNKTEFLLNQFPEKFSFEKDYLEQYVQTLKFYGLIQDVYFIDIGIPEDYLKAQKELS